MRHGAWSPSFLTNVFDGTAVTGEKMALNRTGLMMAAMMALSGTALHDPRSQREREIDDWGLPKREPENSGRRAEKDAAALSKAEAKRARKAAKRLKNMPSNVEFRGEEKRSFDDSPGTQG